MPIWLRKFTFSKLRDHYQPKEEDVVEQSKKAMRSAQNNIPSSKITAPSYVTKASSKK